MARRRNPHAFISSEAANRAIYIDFEGFVNKPPTLLGVLIDDSFEQVVFDPDLESAAEAKELRLTSLEYQVQRLVETCHEDVRVVVAFTEHELDIINEYTDYHIGDVYRNANTIAKKWKKKCYPESTFVCSGLKDYLEFIEYPRPKHLGEKKSTKRIKAVRDMLIRHGSYDSLTPVAKAKWTKLLDHNRIDCTGMKALVQRAAKEIEDHTT